MEELPQEQEKETARPFDGGYKMGSLEIIVLIINNYFCVYSVGNLWIRHLDCGAVCFGDESMNLFEEKMTPAQVAETEKLVREWMEEHK